MSLQMHWEKATVNARIFFYVQRLLREAALNVAQLKRLQHQRLKRLLEHTYENHEFYRERFRQCGFDPYRFSSMEELEQIPVLTKAEYRDFTRSVRAKSPRFFRNWYHDGTSGSSGTPLEIWRTWDERAYMVAKWMRVLYLNGYRWDDVTFSLPSPRRLQKDSLMQRLGIMKRYSIPYTAPVEVMVSTYLKVRPSVLYGNKSQLVDMALYSQRNAVRLPTPRFYVCAAETLDAASRQIILGAFGPNLSEVYGAVEFNTLAWQAVGDDRFHFSHTTDVLELIEDGRPSDRNGYCIITDLFIRSFPLIRYQLGDYFETDTVDGVRVLKTIKGRLDDWIVFKDGSRKPFHSFYQILLRPGILQFRVVQESLDLIRVILVRDRSMSAASLESGIVRDLRSEVRDGDTDYKIEWADEIAPDPTGKLRILISKVQQQESYFSCDQQQ